MYQIKYTSGNEIQVIGKGDNGLSRVVGPNGEIKFEGGYDACEKWLRDRACRPVDTSGIRSRMMNEQSSQRREQMTEEARQLRNRLLDCVVSYQHTLHCHTCSSEIYDEYEPGDVVDRAVARGWALDANGQPVCPGCLAEVNHESENYGFRYTDDAGAPLLACPYCDADLTREGAIQLTSSIDGCLYVARSRLDRSGELIDTDDEAVAAGRHSETSCDACGEDLVRHASQFRF